MTNTHNKCKNPFLVAELYCFGVIVLCGDGEEEEENRAVPPQKTTLIMDSPSSCALFPTETTLEDIKDTQETMVRPTPKKLDFLRQNGGENYCSDSEIQKKRLRSTAMRSKNVKALGEHNEQQPDVLETSSSLVSFCRSMDSDCESDVSSVAKLTGWLDDFGKQQKGHFQKTNDIGKIPQGTSLHKPTRTFTRKTSKRSTTEVVVVEGPTTRGTHGPSMTPVRIKTHTSNVQATNNGYASVKQLSKWLADDPTSKKTTKGCVRKGINIIKKSRAFEKGLGDVIVEEAGLEMDHVSKRKDWLRNAFDDGDDNSEPVQETRVADKKKWLSQAFDEPKDADDIKQTVSMNDMDTRSAISVSDKKDWLSNAFTKETGTPLDEGLETKSSIDVTDKKRWLENAFKKNKNNDGGVADGGSALPSTSSAAEPAKKRWREHSKRRLVAETPRRQTLEEKSTQQAVVPERRSTIDGPEQAPAKAAVPAPSSVRSTRVSAPRVNLPAPAPSSVRSTRVSAARVNLPVNLPQEAKDEQDEEEKPLDFRAARDKLLKRSAANGNPLKVRTKVDMRRAKFEKWEKELQRGCGPKGLLKTSWEQGAEEALPSTSYSKTFQENHVPRKSLCELP